MQLTDIIEAIGSHHVHITAHADEEAEAHELRLEEIYFSVLHGEVIEDYP